jgi:hypothetical protein
LDVLLVEQEVEGSAATPLDIVLAADAERTALLARRDELEALLETEVRATARAWRRTGSRSGAPRGLGGRRTASQPLSQPDCHSVTHPHSQPVAQQPKACSCSAMARCQGADEVGEEEATRRHEELEEVYRSGSLLFCCGQKRCGQNRDRDGVGWRCAQGA